MLFDNGKAPPQLCPKRAKVDEFNCREWVELNR